MSQNQQQKSFSLTSEFPQLSGTLKHWQHDLISLSHGVLVIVQLDDLFLAKLELLWLCKNEQNKQKSLIRNHVWQLVSSQTLCVLATLVSSFQRHSCAIKCENRSSGFFADVKLLHVACISASSQMSLQELVYIFQCSLCFKQIAWEGTLQLLKQPSFST